VPSRSVGAGLIDPLRSERFASSAEVLDLREQIDELDRAAPVDLTWVEIADHCLEGGNRAAELLEHVSSLRDDSPIGGREGMLRLTYTNIRSMSSPSLGPLPAFTYDLGRMRRWPSRVLHFFDRAVLGAVMGAAAFVIERAVIRANRKVTAAETKQ
jgi:hypothetical protein